MALRDRTIPLHGSERGPLTRARVAGRAAPDKRLEVTLHLRSRSFHADPSADELGAVPPRGRKHLSREEFEVRYGAEPRDVEKIAALAREHHLAVVEADAARRTVVLAGASSDLSATFGVERKRYESPVGSYCGHSGPVCVPAGFADLLEGVFGLDDRPAVKRHLPGPQSKYQAKALAEGLSYTPPQIAELYHFPRESDGRGECIAIIELGGGYRPEDLAAYFKQLNLPMPWISSVSVNGAQNRPKGALESFDGEVVGDIETLGGIAPGASIVVYFAPNSERGLFDATTKAIHDKRHRPSVISISWGEAELYWSPRTMRLFNEALREAAMLGVTVCCASGDHGSSGGVSGRSPHVYFPASSPYVLACGGTRLVSSGKKIAKETVWNDGRGASGGGVSAVFPLPDWQASANVPVSANRAHRRGRGVPDVAANADPATGYRIFVDGEQHVGGGTSAAAPVWAGLIARINQKLGHPVGYLTPLLYSEYHRLSELGAFREITEGSNGAYKAARGWNACTGLGSPNGAKLASALRFKKSVKAAKASS